MRVAFRATVTTLDGKVLQQGIVEAVEHRAVPASVRAAGAVTAHPYRLGASQPMRRS